MRSLILALAMFAVATSASADAVNLSALGGAWTFETAPHQDSGCVIRGDVTATRSGASLSMQMHAHETCPSGRVINAEEQCRAAVERGALLVRCVVISSDSQNYNPDQFVLATFSATEMSGRLWDVGVWNGAVRWRRPAPALVS